MSRTLVFASCLAAALGAGAGARADLTIEVKGRTRIEVERIQREGHALVVAGSLLDEALGEPMPGWQVALRVGRLDEDGQEIFYYAVANRSNEDGAFHFAVPGVARGRYVVHLTSIADSVYAAAKPVDRAVDLSRRNVELKLFAPPAHPAASPTLPVTIDIAALERGGDEAMRRSELAVELSIDGRRVATLLVSDGHAATALALPQGAAGKELELAARFAGDEDRAPAEAIVRVRLVDASTVELASESGRVLARNDVTLTGRLRIGARTLGGLPVIVRRIDTPREEMAPSLDAPSVTVTTKPDGTFTATLPAPAVGGRVGFEASFPPSEAKTRGLLPSTSEIVVVEVMPRLAIFGDEPRPTMLALVIGALLALGLGAQRLLARLRAARAARAALGDGRDLPTKVKPKSIPARLFGTLRLPSNRTIAGRVLDAERGRPIAGARVLLRAADGSEHALHTDESGKFAWATVAPGAVELSVSAAGCAPTGHAGVVPHRGELATLDLALVPVRAEIMRRFAAAIEPHLAPGERLGLRTPRELANALVKSTRVRKVRLDGNKLGLLRKLVEDSCFAAGSARPEALAEVTRLLEDLPPAP